MVFSAVVVVQQAVVGVTVVGSSWTWRSGGGGMRWWVRCARAREAQCVHEKYSTEERMCVNSQCVTKYSTEERMCVNSPCVTKEPSPSGWGWVRTPTCTVAVKSQHIAHIYCYRDIICTQTRARIRGTDNRNRGWVNAIHEPAQDRVTSAQQADQRHPHTTAEAQP